MKKAPKNCDIIILKSPGVSPGKTRENLMRQNGVKKIHKNNLIQFLPGKSLVSINPFPTDPWGDERHQFS